jgi:hypothetical protein
MAMLMIKVSTGPAEYCSKTLVKSSASHAEKSSLKSLRLGARVLMIPIAPPMVIGMISPSETSLFFVTLGADPEALDVCHAAAEALNADEAWP